ncbi:ABC-2 type transport system ATP-binding protein [Carboxydocella sporoproducens DSM 16521]|uniref:ABC-2 type transport system ATP-binding protein n=2 Tax=Carboxydocella TaxID=178898 RepID=A0A1T4SGW7_9FIRM|nr:MULTISPECIES: ABC transporter ATP-binding protein [Carboxydocella]AVX19637.1 ABC-2 type transport system ATP-binding protein [Carboxydocella thermautotrophica]SKA27413.1 ABC-2 type transport system ATP-binding protein [Carboxydocella sporoproducens DSM 16521]
MEDVVVLDQVSKTYRDFKLDRVSFTIKKGYIHGFIGRNGAGKTTTIKLMMNLIHRDEGSIRIFGLDNREHERKIKQRLGFVYADNHFYDDLTGEQMKRVIARFYPDWDEKAYNRYLKMFDLPANKKIKHLSRGMQMKYSIALALSHNADLIIMDEPTSGLDPVVRQEILELLSEVIQEGEKTVFFSTHITSDLEQIADFITFIHDGRIQFSLTKDEVLERYTMIKGGTDLLDQDNRKLFIGLRETPYGFEGLTTEPKLVYQLFQDQVLYEKPSLEQIMLYTVKSDKNSTR